MPGPIVGKVATRAIGAWPEAGQHDPEAGPHDPDASQHDPNASQHGAEAADQMAPGTPFFFVQGALDGLARPLAQTEFVIVDLETTGGSPASAAITELAAIRTLGGDRAGQPDAAEEFATLVNPGRVIPPYVAKLTGITDALVAAAPRIEDVLPRFIEFAAGAVLVAHNAPFDISFLTAACTAHNLPWPRLPTLDTAALARQLLTTDEVPDCRLDTLAEFFGAGTRPRHRALDDARATTSVLYALLGRLTSRGIHSLEALRGFAQPSVPKRRRMRQLTAGVPRKPGVCLFTADDGKVLHVMRSSDMQARACGYFTAAETRRRIREMVDKTTRILPLSCATSLEAEVAEIRLIALHRPPYGGRGGEVESDQTADHARSASALAAVPLLVVARPRFSGGWDAAWIRHGRLDGTAVHPRGVGAPVCVAEPRMLPPPEEVSAEVPPPGTAAARHAEAACLLGWLDSPGVRLIDVDGTWCCEVG